MNKKVHNYTPLLLPSSSLKHHHSASTLAQPIRYWKSYIKPEIHEQYLSILNQKNTQTRAKTRRESARDAEKSQVSVFSPNNSYF